MTAHRHDTNTQRKNNSETQQFEDTTTQGYNNSHVEQLLFRQPCIFCMKITGPPLLRI